MGALDLVETPSITFEEILSDGSTLTNPAADHRRLFLGEDGLFHMKDSAGAVTDVGASVADILDLPTAEMDDTLVLAPDGAGGVEFRAEAGGGGSLAAASYKRTSGNYSTASTTFVNVDGTNLSLSITTGARRVQIGFVGALSGSTQDTVLLDVTVDGTRVGGDRGITAQMINSPFYTNASFTFLTDVLSAASHTFNLQWATLGGATATLHGVTASNPTCQFYVLETAATA
jgi:hypothetical protein